MRNQQRTNRTVLLSSGGGGGTPNPTATPPPTLAPTATPAPAPTATPPPVDPPPDDDPSCPEGSASGGNNRGIFASILGFFGIGKSAQTQQCQEPPDGFDSSNPIHQKWWKLKQEGVELEWPGGEATLVPSPYGTTGTAGYFPNGTIYNSELGMFAVYGAILSVYNNTGKQTGTLGFPYTDERADLNNNQRVSYFEGGYIAYDQSIGGYRPYSGATNVSDQALAFIGEYEGFCPNLYNDRVPKCGLTRSDGQDVGHCTIGYGHKVHDGACDGRASEQEFTNGITREEALPIFRNDSAGEVNTVKSLVTIPLQQHQFDAMVSFKFNLKVAAVQTFLTDTGLNNGNFDGVLAEMKLYVNAGSPIEDGLTKRRCDEGQMFLRGDYVVDRALC